MLGCFAMMKLKHKDKKISVELTQKQEHHACYFPLISYELNMHCFLVSVAAEQLFVVGHFTSYNAQK